MGCGISISFVSGAEYEIYVSCYNVFLQFLYYRVRNKRLGKTIVSMLPCRALERGNNPYIESMWNLVLPKIRKGSSLCGFDWKENSEKWLRQRKKVSLS